MPLHYLFLASLLKAVTMLLGMGFRREMIDEAHRCLGPTAQFPQLERFLKLRDLGFETNRYVFRVTL
jgi:hypothetical protein